MPSADTDDPIVITGVGVVSPLGRTCEATWLGVLSGRSAARRLTAADFLLPRRDPRWDATAWLGCPADLPVDSAWDRVTALGLRAAAEASADAGLDRTDLDPNQIGCVFGTSKGSLFAATADWCGLGEVSSFPALWPSATAHAIAARFGWTGPCLAPVAACATGLVAVIRAAALIREGACDVVLAGSADDSLHPLVLASFQRLGVLARHAEPTQASRPFDRDRNGFVIGVGAGGLVLERKSHAVARGARWYAAVGPGRFSADPSGMTALDDSGATLARLIADSVPADRVPDVINLHGTGTRLNDPAECRAVRLAIPQAARDSRAGSFKGALGHLLGAAGSVELALLCLAIRDQTLPPNVNRDCADPDCDLNWIGATPEPATIKSVLKLSLGFGGHQAAVWLERCRGVGERTVGRNKGSEV
ncbi:MAG TPA: beta-ketoacyl-[acyl-carrier-protein] synthase family protein [Planctomycetaceae bacterium]|nr:beta-ketoacyl-[acyl-carrier-protein] synthase family protein [Planctomycetaceae bacterium]